MRNYKDHLILEGSPIKEALAKLNELAMDAILFVINKDKKLIGSLTDGDVRRGLLRDLSMDNKVEDFILPNPRYLKKENYTIEEVIRLREGNFKIVPVLNKNNEIINVINFRFFNSYLPVDAIVMAGGRGSRLKPLTDKTPKPLLKVGNKSIIDYNIDRLRKFGIDDYWISLRYLGNQIQQHLGNGENSGISLNYIWENEPLGTIGAVSLVNDFQHDVVLITNSDILTTLNYEDFYLDFLKKEADMAVVTVPYTIDIPYAVMETNDNQVTSFKEKPTYTYYSNGGIYLIKTEILKKIPKGVFYNATDLMEKVIVDGLRLVSFPIRQYWLDIGKHEDFKKAQEDINHIIF